MIVVHLFLRKEKRGVSRLMCESTATDDLRPVYANVEELFTVRPEDKRDRVIEKAKQIILTDRPELEFVSVLENKEAEGTRPCSFDLTFRPRKTLLDKLLR